MNICDQNLKGMFAVSFNINMGGQLIKLYDCAWRGLIKQGKPGDMEMTAGHYLSLGHRPWEENTTSAQTFHVRENKRGLAALMHRSSHPSECTVRLPRTSISGVIVRWNITGDEVACLLAAAVLPESLTPAAEAIPICREVVARWSHRVNEARPWALSHPATTADPSPDYCNEIVISLLSKRCYTSTRVCTYVRKRRERPSLLKFPEVVEVESVSVVNNTMFG